MIVPLGLTLAVAVPLSAALSLALLVVYKRAVLRAMRERAEGSPGVSSSRPALSPPAEDASAPRRGFVSGADTTEGRQAEASLFPSAGQRLLAGLRVYLAGIAVLQATLIGAAWAAFEGRGGLHFGSLFWNYAWPLFLTIGLVAAISRRQRAALVASYVLAAAALLFADASLDPSLDLWREVADAMLESLVAMIVLMFLHSSIRPVAPMLLPLVILTVLGAVGGFFLLTGALRWLVAAEGWAPAKLLLGLTFGFLGNTGTAALLHAIGALPLLWLGWLVLKGIGRLYRQKRISSLAITMHSLVTANVLVSITNFQAVGGFYWTLPILGLLAYLAVVSMGWRRLRSAWQRPRREPGLLVLRVFALGARSERLFVALAKLWLSAGPIHLIAGPDLIKRTVQPPEFLDFLGGKLARRFVLDQRDLEQRLDALDVAPDPDGRFRVNEFYCRTDTWQATMRRLAERSDAILMDLRGFSSSRQGCLFELGALVDLRLTGRAVLVVDRTTDRPLLDSTLQTLGCGVDRGPAAGKREAPTFRVFELGRGAGGDVKALAQLLFSAA